MDGIILVATRQLLQPQTAKRRTTIRQIYLGAGLALLILLLMLLFR
jgi:hypothetical protein